MKAPLRLSPLDNTTPICRFHNYSKKGCLRFLNPQADKKTTNVGKDLIHLDLDKTSANSSCELDHEHCHMCFEKGHVALNCTSENMGPLL